MKSKLLHEHSMAEYLYTEILQERARYRGEPIKTAELRWEKEKKREGDPMPSADSKSKKDPNQTIASALEEIEKSEFASREELKKGVLGKTGLEYLKLISLYSLLSTATDAGQEVDDINKGINPAMVKANIADYPLLDKLDIFPGYLRILDNIVLKQISTEYKKKILKPAAADPAKLVSSIQDINDFIPEHLLKRFKVKISKGEAE